MLTQKEKDLIVTLYVDNGMNITAVVKEVMKQFKHHYRDIYDPVSDFLHEKKLMRHGMGKRFCTNFKYKDKSCAVCHLQYSPTSRSQRFCKLCTGNDIKGMHMLVSYGITFDDYQLLLKKQKNQCAICCCNLRMLKSNCVHVDHCHKTAKVRGIVCTKCNTRLQAIDDENWLIKAQEYVKQSGIEPKCECVTLRKLRKQKNTNCETLKAV